MTNQLSPAEQEILVNATWQDWMEALAAVGELVKTRDFWADMGREFLNGMARGPRG